MLNQRIQRNQIDLKIYASETVNWGETSLPMSVDKTLLDD
jgi:hypothetical protein